MIGTYTPSVFDVTDIDAAKNIILTPEITKSTQDRWIEETQYTMELIKRLHLSSDKTVLDFGCGIGRLSKEIVNTYGCTTVGMDISMNMRGLANVYVNNNKFSAVAPSMWYLVPKMFDVIIAVWSLQHVLDLEKEINCIKEMLKPDGKLFVINERKRYVPTDKGWVDDKQDIFMSLQRHFNTEVIDILDSNIVDANVPERTFWGIFINK